MDFLNKDYGNNDYNMKILPYRIVGSDEYSTKDIVDLNEDRIAKLTEIFNTNNNINCVMKIKIFPLYDGEKYSIDYNEKKLVINPEVFSNYMHIKIKEINEGNVSINWHMRIYEFNDSKFGVELKLSNSKFYVCEDFDGVLKYLHDIGYVITS